MSCNFHVGQKVVCINDSWITVRGPEGGHDPVKGSVYTIEKIIFDDCCYLILEEFFQDDEFHSEGFRPLVEKKTDISIFTAMLTKKNLKVDA